MNTRNEHKMSHDLYVIANMAYDDGHNFIGTKIKTMAKALEHGLENVNIQAIRQDLQILIDRDNRYRGSGPGRAHLELALEIVA